MLFKSRTATLIAVSVLTAAGLAGNYLKLPLFFNVDFIFGGIAVMLVVTLFGTGWGTLSAVAASSYTYFLWNHPYAFIIFVGEALFVGLLLKRTRMNLVLIDIVYWLCIGMPLAWFFYHVVMKVDTSRTVLVMLKQSLNGITNALIAAFLVCVVHGLVWRLRRNTDHPTPIPASHLVFNLLMTTVLIPCLCITVLSGRYEAKAMETTIKENFNRVSLYTGALLEGWIDDGMLVIRSLAIMAGNPDEAAAGKIQKQVDTLRRAMPNFVRLAVFDGRAVSVAFSPSVDERGNSTRGVDYSDRAYYKELKATLAPVISNVLMSRVGSPRPALLIAAPVVIGGEFRGCAVGSVNLEKLGALLKQIGGHWSIQATILDRNGMVIASNLDGIKTNERFAKFDGRERRPLGEGMDLIMPSARRGMPMAKRWEASLYAKESVVSGGAAGWKLLLTLPAAGYLDELQNIITRHLLLMMVFVLLATVISIVLSARLVSPLLRLQEATGGLPEKLATGGDINYPVSSVKEIALLVNNFKYMSDSLRLKFREINIANETLEQKVEERTRELYDVNTTLKGSEELIRVSLSEKEVLLREVHHRVKNNMQLISSLLSLQSKYITDEKLQAVFSESRDRIRSMALIHESLYQTESMARIDFGKYLRSLVDALSRSYGRPGISIIPDAANITLSTDNAVPCGLIINELVSNALKHAFASGTGGKVFIRMQLDDKGTYELSVKDTWIGFPDGMDFRNTQSLGLQLVTILIGQLHGSVDLIVDGGTEFRITFPVEEEQGREEHV